MCKQLSRFLQKGLFGVLIFVACTRESQEVPEAVSRGGNALLTFSVELMGTSPTRAALPAEQIQDLRIVMVSLDRDSHNGPIPDDEDGIAPADAFVEVDTLLTANMFNGIGRREIHFENVAANRMKRIYFLANCASAQSSYPAILDGSGTPLDLSAAETWIPVDGKAPVDEGVFTAAAGTYENQLVPITAVHEFSMPSMEEMKQLNGSGDGGYRIEPPFYLLRAVNKMELSFTNESGSSPVDGVSDIAPKDIRLKSFTLSKLNSGRSYLFAHPDADDAMFDAYRPSAEELALPLYERSNLNPAWMLWLEQEADKTQQGGNHENIEYQWLREYALPAPVSHADVTASFSDNWTSSRKDADAAYPSVWEAPVFYFPESRYLADGATEQQYGITCVFERRNDGTTDEITRSAVLPRLKSLFRDTHVLTNIRITDDARIELTLEVLPWTNAPEEEWDYTEHVSVSAGGFLQWDAGSYEDDDREKCQLLLREGTTAVGRFTLATPKNDNWYAFLIPESGDPDAFEFVDEAGRSIDMPTGIVDGTTEAVVRIRARKNQATETNKAKLQIMVRSADNRYYLVADVCGKEGISHYVIVQNLNSF